MVDQNQWSEVRDNLWRKEVSPGDVYYHVCGSRCDRLRRGAHSCPISGLCVKDVMRDWVPSVGDSSVSLRRRRMDRLDCAYGILSDFCRVPLEKSNSNSDSSAAFSCFECLLLFRVTRSCCSRESLLWSLCERVLSLWELHSVVGGFVDSVCDLAYIASEGLSVCGGSVLCFPRNDSWLSLLPERRMVQGRSSLRTRYLSSIRRSGFQKFSKWIS